MLITASGFSVLLQTLGLTQGLSKPTPDIPVIPSGVRGTDDYSSAALPHFQALSHLPGQHLALSNPASAQSLDQTDGSCNVNPYTAPASLYHAFPPFDQAEANVYRYRQQQSVNLGSWSASCLNHA
jgi:glucan 1,3-beta-glucosidase